jgi:methylmalonyl-CoA mutase
LARAVECARARATLGEISAAMEDVFGRYDTVPTPVSGIYGGAHGDSPQWRQAGEGVDAVERRLGRRPRMLVAKMGQDGHDRGANLVSSAFADLASRSFPARSSRRRRRARASLLQRTSTWSARPASPQATRRSCPS